MEMSHLMFGETDFFVRPLFRLSTPNAKDKSKAAQNAALKDFADSAGEQLKSLKVEANRSEALFKQCAEYFGESAKAGAGIDTNTFFGYLVRT
jgi:hypothetical protein